MSLHEHHHVFLVRDGGTDDARDAAARIKALKSEGGPWIVSIRPAAGSRSRAQQNTYWLWLREIGSITGADAEELHDFFRGKYLGRFVDDDGVESLASTTTLSVADMRIYMDRIAALAGEMGWTLTDPRTRVDGGRS